jgi:uncharacterized protein (TIGR00369 family)
MDNGADATAVVCMNQPARLDPDYADFIRDSFERQGAIETIGARLVELAPGICRISLPVTDRVTQNHGYVHAGILGMIADAAGSYAAMTLYPPGREVLTIEYKINFLAPATGKEMVAAARVLRSGRNISVAQVEIFSINDDGAEKLCAMVQQTVTPG